ncbi:MAG: nucleotide-binding universal stress UspA family protein [Vicingaceae bacterium]|jgi:nucleotide-binding universal stress UspA family protein
MKHILFPTDFSDNSDQAYPYALDIAYLLGAELVIFNSYQLPHSKSNVILSIVDRMKDDSINSLKKLKEETLLQEKYKNLNIKTTSRSGSFVSLIPKVANEFQSDLIVMGTKGASSLKEMFIGTNTLEVIQTTKIPILTVPEKAKNNKVDKIAMAVDLQKIKNPEQLRPLLEMAKLCRASIEFVHVMHPDDKDSTEDRFNQIMFLEKFASEIKSNINIITDTDIIEGLSRYVETEKPDMLAMLSRKHTLFERLFTQSITNKLAFRSEIPLLVMDE